MNRGKSITKAALAGGMDVKTARKYQMSGKLPSEMKQAHVWRTRKDPYEDTWKDLLQSITLLKSTIPPVISLNSLTFKFPRK
jgi:hypothetical protein